MPMFVDTSPPGQCIFCRLVAGEIPSARVYEDALTIAFMDIGQVNPGHVLVATKRHAATLLDITAEEAAAVMQTAQQVARAVQAAFNPPGLTLLQANGREGDQTVFHFHLHVVPRHAQDGIALTWGRAKTRRPSCCRATQPGCATPLPLAEGAPALSLGGDGRVSCRSRGQSYSTKRSKVSLSRCSHTRLSALLAKLASKLLNASW